MRLSFSLTSALAGALFALSVASAPWAKASPSLVEDNAGLMRAEEREHLSEYHAYLLTDHDIDYRVVTVENVGDINIYAVKRFEDLEVGGRSKTGRGLLLVVDRTQDLVRLEVGHALEGVYPDAFVAYIEHRQMVPFFRADRLVDGILAATEIIVTRAQRAEAEAGFDDEVWVAGSGGGGATTRARLGAGKEAARADRASDITGGRTPKQTLRSHFEAMQDRNGDPGLAIYTPATRRMLQGWVMTPAQMDKVLEAYRRCHAESARFGPEADIAVIRYPIKERACAPWFFRKIDGAWALDLTMMQRAIRFGRSNAWRFDFDVSHPYEYAFADWKFDRHGFPRKRR